MDILQQFANHNKLLNRSKHTISSYNHDVKQFIDFISDRKSELKDITVQDIRQFLAYLSMKDIAKSSIARKLSSLKTFFSFLLSKKIIVEDPAALLRSPRIGRFLPNIITKQEMKKILSVVDLKSFSGKRDRAILDLLYSSGMRASELLSLKDDDINLAKRELKVMGKGSKERVVFFNQDTQSSLLAYIPYKRSKFPYSSSLFVNRSGNVLTDRFLRKMVRKYSQEANIGKEISPHTFRHSFATLLLDNGLSLKYIQDILGHASISSTQIYTHTSREALRESYLKHAPKE